MVGNVMVPELATNILCDAPTQPLALAEIVVVPVFWPVTLKEPVVLPAGMTTLALSKLTIPVGVAERATVTPFGEGAGRLNVMVPGFDRVNPTAESSVSVMVGVTTFIVALPATHPPADAVIVSLPAKLGVTLTVAVVWVAVKLTVDGTVAAEPLLCRMTVCPLPPGAVDSVTVRV